MMRRKELYGRRQAMRMKKEEKETKDDVNEILCYGRQETKTSINK